MNTEPTMLPVATAMADWRTGSHDAPWTWDDEFNDLINHPHIDDLIRNIRTHGIQQPILLGNDGRIWDGRHRIYIATILGIKMIPVEHAPASTPETEPASP